MKKVEALKKLAELAKEKTFATGKYCSEGNNCAIGHLLKIGGLTEEGLKEIDEGKYDNWYSIGSVINEIKKYSLRVDNVKESLSTLGFNIDSETDQALLQKLQTANDRTQTSFLAVLEDEIMKLETSEKLEEVS